VSQVRLRRMTRAVSVGCATMTLRRRGGGAPGFGGIHAEQHFSAEQ
jgi:hypothetical protein